MKKQTCRFRVKLVVGEAGSGVGAPTGAGRAGNREFKSACIGSVERGLDEVS